MTHELYYDSTIDCIILRFQAKVTMRLIREVAPQTARMIAETGCQRLLNDMSKTTIDIPVTELFNSPKVMDESKISYKIKRALVVPPAFSESSFLENVSRNRGHNLMVFKDIEEAKKWLLPPGGVVSAALT